MAGRRASEGFHVLAIDVGHPKRQRERRLASLPRAGQYLVLHVGDVPHVRDIEPSMSQRSDQDVEHHCASGMPGVGHVVDRRTADVEPHLSLDGGSDVLWLPS